MLGTMQRNLKRVMRDYQDLVKNGPENNIWIKPATPDGMDLFYIMIKASEGPYQGSLFFFTLEPWTTYTGLENQSGHTYPATPPKVLHQSPFSIRAHPNLYHTGGDYKDTGRVGGAKVCLSILGTWSGPGWTPMYTFMHIFQSIHMILDNEPLRNEPGYTNGNHPAIADFTKYVQYVCLQETFERTFMPIILGSNYDHVPYLKLFEEEIKEIWTIHKEWYVNHARRLESENQKITLSIYGDRNYVGHHYKFTALEKLL
jgi:ubiquitin-protein ligase